MKVWEEVEVKGKRKRRGWCRRKSRVEETEEEERE